MFTSIGNSIFSVFSLSLPMVIISIVVLISLRVVDILKNKKEFCLYKELITLSFIIYILCLFQAVTFQDASNFSSNNFIPFKEMFRYDFGSRLFIKNVLGNIIMFMPYGFFASYYLKEEKLPSVFILVFILSIAIETTQLTIGRVFDIDDIFLNVIGGVIGHYLYKFILRIGSICPNLFFKEWFLNLVAIILLIGLITLL